MQIPWAYIHRLYILSNICRGGKIYCIPAMSQTKGSRKCSRLRGSRGATCFIFTSSLNSLAVLCGPMRRDQRMPRILAQTFSFLGVNCINCVDLLFFQGLSMLDHPACIKLGCKSCLIFILQVHRGSRISCHENKVSYSSPFLWGYKVDS